MTNPTSAGYIVTDNEAIHGVGATADAAWADMIANLDAANVSVVDSAGDADQSGNWTLASNFTTRSASAALLADVEARGGAIAWVMVGGVACTVAEAEG